ncbi:CshA/CshB family fibrillar adhesin-related protein [Cellulophaga sp. BC115SP]|uniref:CshA/CshB family fibrillar adhesin-related protein n=1 Tax=Cellulophaga sp. BC115SP TaxID=2683263 RepID=UPI001413543B|nr:CshA/CshB family fibrillar adhesin-related protein [Cellulophaga sp. BC115SP]
MLNILKGRSVIRTLSIVLFVLMGFTTRALLNLAIQGFAGGIIPTLSVSPKPKVASPVMASSTTVNKLNRMLVLADFDGDGVSDEVDIDDDNDGIPDETERYCDQPLVANSVSGNGTKQDKFYFFNWTDAVFTDGIHNKDSQTFVLPDGVTVTATFSNIVKVGGEYRPTDMNTWSGSYSHQMYNTAGNKEAFQGADGADIKGRLTFTATKNGNPWPLDIVVTDAEASAPPLEYVRFITVNGEPFRISDFRGTPTITGQNTDTLTYVATTSGNNFSYTRNATIVDFDVTGGGVSAFAFGLYLVCDTDGDGITNDLDLDSDNDGCSDAFEAGATSDKMTNFQFTTAVGANGLPDVVETAVDNGTINYVSSYNQYAIVSTLKICTCSTVPPTLSVTAISNICPVTTIDLSTVTVLNTQTDNVLTWHSGTPVTTANKLSSITALAGGTYYAAFYAAGGNCYSPTSGVTAVISDCCNSGSVAPVPRQ